LRFTTNPWFYFGRREGKGFTYQKKLPAGLTKFEYHPTEGEDPNDRNKGNEKPPQS
jgi:hypothetical protein